MLTLNVTAENFNELKQKTFEILGLSEPLQKEMVFEYKEKNLGEEIPNSEPMDTGVSAPLDGLVNPVKRKRRSKAEMEAAKEGSIPEEAVNEPVDTDKAYTMEDCKALLSQVIGPDKSNQENLKKAVQLLTNFGIKKLPELDPKHFPSFVMAANILLGAEA